MDWRQRLKQLTGIEDEDRSRTWHAVFVMTGNEERVRQKIEYALKDSGIFAIVPKRLLRERKNGVWHDRVRPLFPGYILLQGQVTVPDYYILKKVPGILRILKDKNGLYRINPEEIRIISRLMTNGELIGASTAFQNGDSIVITEGPLLGLEGLIKAVDYRKGRVKVTLSFLGDERTIDLSIRMVKTAL